MEQEGKKEKVEIQEVERQEPEPWLKDVLIDIKGMIGVTDFWKDGLLPTKEFRLYLKCGALNILSSLEKEELGRSIKAWPL